jgi:hypothetical protein
MNKSLAHGMYIIRRSYRSKNFDTNCPYLWRPDLEAVHSSQYWTDHAPASKRMSLSAAETWVRKLSENHLYEFEALPAEMIGVMLVLES